MGIAAEMLAGVRIECRLAVPVVAMVAVGLDAAASLPNPGS